MSQNQREELLHLAASIVISLHENPIAEKNKSLESDIAKVDRVCGKKCCSAAVQGFMDRIKNIAKKLPKNDENLSQGVSPAKPKR